MPEHGWGCPSQPYLDGLDCAVAGSTQTFQRQKQQLALGQPLFTSRAARTAGPRAKRRPARPLIGPSRAVTFPCAAGLTWLAEAGGGAGDWLSQPPRHLPGTSTIVSPPPADRPACSPTSIPSATYPACPILLPSIPRILPYLALPLSRSLLCVCVLCRGDLHVHVLDCARISPSLSISGTRRPAIVIASTERHQQPLIIDATF
jgi:hypothetical protein